MRRLEKFIATRQARVLSAVYGGKALSLQGVPQYVIHEFI